MSDAVADLGRRIHRLDDLLRFREKPVHIVGAGSVEGAHLLLFLLDRGFSRLVGHDFSEEQTFDRAFRRVHVGWPVTERDAMLERLRQGVTMRFRDRYLQGVEEAAAIGVTQGWYLYAANQRLADSSDLRSRFFSLMQLYLALAPGIVVGVTGSQGKSTTTGLLHAMLTAGGRSVIFAGNDRHSRQALGEVVASNNDTLLLLEISNRHLKSLGRSPGVAVVTNVYPNHLDEHGGWTGYVSAKSEILRYQRQGDIAVLNSDLEVTREMAGVTPAEVVWFGERMGLDRGVAVHADTISSQGLAPFELRSGELALPGRHNLENVAAAAAAALALGIEPAAVAEAGRRFRGLKHRIQFIWESGGVRFYDDLNSTTPTASEAALRTLGAGVIWIFGGDDKGLDGGALAGSAKESVRAALALPGPGSDKLVASLLAAGVQVELLEDLPAAVARSVRIAQPGESVLLSPACPGFFSRYYVGADEDTGFRQLVRVATLGETPTSPPARRPRKSEDPG